MDGTLRIIDPTFELAAEATAAAEALLQPGPGIAGDLLQQELRRSLPVLRTLAQHVDEVATQLRAGRLSVRVERFADGDERVVSGWIDRILVAVFGCVGLVASGVILVAAELARSRDVRLSLQAIGFIGLVFSSVLFMRAVAQVLRRERTSLEPQGRSVGAPAGPAPPQSVPSSASAPRVARVAATWRHPPAR